MTCANTAETASIDSAATTDYNQNNGDNKPCQKVETTPWPPPIPVDRVFLAPMVRGSELAFRQLVRRYGVQICYSPMLRAKHVVAAYNNYKNGNDTCDNDNMHEDGWLLRHDIMADSEPVVVQLCGNEPKVLAEATRVLLDLHYTGACQIEGIDLNLGCPQTCAKRGYFGAFLAQHKPTLALECVAAMRHTIDTYDSIASDNGHHKIKPRLSCKFRLQQDLDTTIQFARDLVLAGCQLLAVHCRQMTDKHDGEPNLQAATRIVQAVAPTPVVINGWSWETCAKALQQTKAFGVMVARDFLRNPRLLSSVGDSTTPDPGVLATEYLEFCELHPPPSELYYKLHFRWLFRAALEPDASQKFNPATYAQDWRPRFWNFLARPYLTSHEQFQQIVVLYWQYRWNNVDTNDDKDQDDKQPEFPVSLRKYLTTAIDNDKDSTEAETNQQLSAAITFHSIRYYNNN